jgi:hypothetical protein
MLVALAFALALVGLSRRVSAVDGGHVRRRRRALDSEDLRGNGDMQPCCSGSVPNRDTPPPELPPEDYVQATVNAGE